MLCSRWIQIEMELARSHNLYILDADGLLDCWHAITLRRGTVRAEWFVGILGLCRYLVVAGVIMFECLVGILPPFYADDDPVTTCRKILR
jgi:hypothetical protein